MDLLGRNQHNGANLGLDTVSDTSAGQFETKSGERETWIQKVLKMDVRIFPFSTLSDVSFAILNHKLCIKAQMDKGGCVSNSSLCSKLSQNTASLYWWRHLSPVAMGLCSCVFTHLRLQQAVNHGVSPCFYSIKSLIITNLIRKWTLYY